MKKYIFYFSFFSLVIFSTLFSTGCDDAAPLPSYVKIDTIIVDSTNFNLTGELAPKINFAWIYIDDNLQGVYTLPCKFPVIGEGVKKFEIFGGVYEFGNGNAATRYIFYNSWTTNDTLVVQDTLVLTPHVEYIDTNIVFEIQDFDADPGDFVYSAGSGAYDINYLGGFEGGHCLAMFMGPADTTNFIIEKATPIYVPKNGVGYFVELNYKCNTPFYFDIKTSTSYRSIVGFNTKNEWNKAYINVTYAIDNTPGTDVKLVFKMFRDASIPNQEVFIDNLKLIYMP